MSNRLYRLIVGLVIIISLYLEQPNIIYLLVTIVLFEGITNLRIPRILSNLPFGQAVDPDEGNLAISFKSRYEFEAERAWRIIVASVLLAAYLLPFHEAIWFIPWFMGFTIIGAGASGVCPMFLTLKWAGFK